MFSTLKAYFYLEIRTRFVYYVSMNRTVDLEILNEWLDLNGGVVALSSQSSVSAYTLMKLKNRKNPLVPKKVSTLVKIATATGVSVDVLFPLGAKRRKSAS